MHQESTTSKFKDVVHIPRRRLLGATAMMSTAVAMTGLAGREAAHASVVLGQRAGSNSLGLQGTVVGRHQALFRTYSPTSSTALAIVTVGSTRYLISLNTGDGPDSVQVFSADTGALVFRASTPTKVVGNLVHDGKDLVYFSSGQTLMRISLTARSVQQVGSLPAGVTTLTECVFDAAGRLWAGTYPTGVVVCLDPGSGRELSRTPVLGAGNDYVKSLSISPDGRVLWAGTGTADPDLFKIDIAAPSKPTRVSIPGRGRDALVMRTAARGRKVFVWHPTPDGRETASVYDTDDATWGAAPTPIAGRAVSRADSDGFVYVNANGTLTRLNPLDRTMTAHHIGSVREKYSWHVGLAGSTAYVLTPSGSGLSADRVDLANGTSSPVAYAVVTTTVPTQSMVIDPATNTAYAGGYRGDGLCATDLATGAFAHSAAGSKISQIEGMIIDSGKMYVGSYGSAVVVEHDLARGVTDVSSFRQLARLGESHLQSRIFAWTVAQSHVVFGTVPEYGHRGGALGTINRSTGQVTVYNKLIPELSIVGLAATGHTVYGTTSCRSGYGIDDHPGPAVAFATDARTGAVLWKRVLPGLTEAYGPVLLGGKLYIGTVNGVVELRLTDGAPLRTFVFNSRTARAAWNTVHVAVIPGTERLAHLVGGTLTVVEPSTARFSTVLTGANKHLSFDGSGALWVTVGNDVVKLRLDQAVATTTGVGVKGAIGAKYTAGGGAAVFGAPAFAERAIPGGAYQVFQKDGRSTKIMWSSATGARAVKEYGAIGKAWMRAGYERGWGWPVTDEYLVGTEVRQRFSRGVTAHYRAGRTWTT